MAKINFPESLPVSAEQIEKILPHRFPFLLVDRILKLEGGTSENRAGRRILARKNITFNEPFFPGHFPGKPIFPGVLMIEAMAQACALAAYIPGRGDYICYIASIQKAKFRSPVVPGDTIELSADCIKDRGSMIVFSCKAHVDNSLVSEAEIWAKIM